MVLLLGVLTVQKYICIYIRQIYRYPCLMFIRNFEFFVNMFISHDILFRVLDYLCDAHALTFLRYFGSIKFARDIIILLRNDILTILRRKHLL